MEPKMIFVAGTPCSGKTTLARALVRAVPNTLLLEKDVFNNELSYLRETEQGELPSMEKMLRSYDPRDLRAIVTPMGPMIKVPWGGEFYGRHVRDQSNLAMIAVARQNLEMGKLPVYESLFPHQFESGSAEEVIAAFSDYPVKIIYTHLSEVELKRRMMERLGEPGRDIKDEPKLRSEESWREEMKRNPIIPRGLENYDHLLINTEEPLEECVNQSFRYITQR